MRKKSRAATGIAVAPAMAMVMVMIMVMVLSAPIVTAQTPPAHSTNANSLTVTDSKPVKMLFALTAAKGSVTLVSGKKAHLRSHTPPCFRPGDVVLRPPCP